MALSAAELQKRHGLEGAPDPFPTIDNRPAASQSAVNGSASASSSAPVNAASEEAFPSLGPSGGPATSIAKPAISAWSAKPSSVKAGKAKAGTPAPAPGGIGRTGSTTTSQAFSDTFELPMRDIADGKILAETMKKVMDQTGAQVESSTQMKTGMKTFHIKAADAKRLTVARRLIERGLSKSVTIQVEVPISTLGTIIGPKGATLKGIQDATQAKIDVPRRDTLPAWDPKQHANDDDNDDEPEEPMVPISVAGPSVACNDARTRILALISGRVSQSSVTIKTVPSSFYPFIAGPKGNKARQLEDTIGEGSVKVHIPPPAVWKALERQGLDDGEASTDRDIAIKVRGEKEKVRAVVANILNQYEELAESMRELRISIPKRQHRFLVGNAADEILAETGCVVELPPVDDPSDQCIIRGPPSSLAPALSLVMEKANSVAVETIDVVALHRSNASDPLTHAKRTVRYLQRSSRLRSVADAHPGVKIFPPFPASIASSGNVAIEIVGDNRADVAKAKEALAALVRSVHPTSVSSIEIDPIVHSLLIGKKGGKISQFETQHKVASIFPPPADESSEVLLVYSGLTDDLPGDKKARDAFFAEHLAAATTALQSLAKDAADIKTENMDVDHKYHGYIIGPGGSILNALIGEDGMVDVRVGSRNKGTTDDTVTVRGPADEVDRVVAQIKQIVEDAKNDAIVNGHTVDFVVDKNHIRHLVGAGGASINKLREALGVRVDFDDEADDTKSKKPMVRAKIVGRKEAVEEAKKRLQAQIEKMEDETSETITVKREIQPALIGTGGKYAIRLEEKYGVKITFPREKEGAPASKPDEVLIRGGRKGVAAAKTELLDAAAFESESRQSASFTVPSGSVAQIVGKGGATINGIKAETSAQIDIDKASGESATTTITLRGDKKSIAAAKTAILAVVDSLGQETSVSMTIDPKYHRSLIGQGGGKLRDLITNAGGPSEGFRQAGLVNFPRPGDDATDQVRLRGESKLMVQLQAALAAQVEAMRNTIILGVAVPAAQHASKIGRGGNSLQDLQRKSGAIVHFPGSRQYGNIGDIENSSDLEGTDAADIVKVIGTKEAIAVAAELLQQDTSRPASRQPQSRTIPDLPSRTVPIPTKYYHAITSQPNLLRQIRGAGGYLNFPQPAPPRSAAKPKANGDDLAAKTARIDLNGGDDTSASEGDWELRQNFEEADEAEMDWMIRAKEEDLDKVVAMLTEAVEKAKAASHVGLLSGLPRSAFPRIIGSKGATISRLRADTGADINVGKDDDLITITGDEASVLQAREAILAIVSRPSRY